MVHSGHRRWTYSSSSTTTIRGTLRRLDARCAIGAISLMTGGIRQIYMVGALDQVHSTELESSGTDSSLFDILFRRKPRTSPLDTLLVPQMDDVKTYGEQDSFVQQRFQVQGTLSLKKSDVRIRSLLEIRATTLEPQHLKQEQPLSQEIQFW